MASYRQLLPLKSSNSVGAVGETAAIQNYLAQRGEPSGPVDFCLLLLRVTRCGAFLRIK